MTTTTKAPHSWGTLTSTCTCTYLDDDDNEVQSTECFGDCWEDSLEFFRLSVEPLLTLSDLWEVSGFPLWYGEVGGVFRATTARQFVEALTVRGEWYLRYRIYDDRMEFSLAHHDAPTGSDSVVRPVSDDDD